MWTTLADVSVTDAISGSVTASSCSGGSCDFTVTVTDLTTSGSRSMLWRTTDTGRQLVGGAFEGIAMNNCGDYPQSQVAYSNLAVADRSGPVSLTSSSWGKIPGTGYMSGCGTDFVTTGTTITFRNVSLSVIAAGLTSVNTGESCTYSAIPNGGYAPNSYTWTVDGTILSGQNTGVINASFSDGIHAVTVHATDGKGFTASNTIDVDSESEGRRGCER